MNLIEDRIVIMTMAKASNEAAVNLLLLIPHLFISWNPCDSRTL
jgi:hypothetical protein